MSRIKVTMTLTTTPLFTFYRGHEYKLIKEEEFRSLLEDENGNRMWCSRGYSKKEPAP